MLGCYKFFTGAADAIAGRESREAGTECVFTSVHITLRHGLGCKKQSGHVHTNYKMLKDGRHILQLFTSTLQGYRLRDSCLNLCSTITCTGTVLQVS